jgi:phospholipid/cholesterol/gamma-HCH transport system ATP-binding protein
VPIQRPAIHELVLSTRDRFGATSLVVTHDIRALPDFADRLLFLCDGVIGFLGTPEAFLGSNDATVRAFTGAANDEKEAHHGQLFAR